jgi:hypothetical protein
VSRIVKQNIPQMKKQLTFKASVKIGLLGEWASGYGVFYLSAHKPTVKNNAHS